MSVPAAMQFIQKVRMDEALRGKLQALGPAADLERIAQLGAEAGYNFTVEDMQTAFKHDWTMRWIYYGRNEGN